MSQVSIALHHSSYKTESRPGLEWLNEHPGGVELIFDFAGKDASEGYNSNHDPELVFSKLSRSSNKGEVKGPVSQSGPLTPPPSQRRPKAAAPTTPVAPIPLNYNPTTPKKTTPLVEPDEDENMQDYFAEPRELTTLEQSSINTQKRQAEYGLRMAHSWTVYDGTFDPMPQDKRRKRDVPYPSYVQHAFRSRSGLSNLQLSRDAPVSMCALDIANSHVWKCMPGLVRRYVYVVAPNGPALWSDNKAAEAFMFKRLDDINYHTPVYGKPKEYEYKLFGDMKKRPWLIWPLWVEDKYGKDYVTVVSYSESTPETAPLFPKLISYSIIDPRRSKDKDAAGRHQPIAARIQRIQGQLLKFWKKGGFDTTELEYKEILCSPMPLNESTSGERCFATVKDITNQIIQWYIQGGKFCKADTIKALQKWVNPFQQRVEMTGINAWMLMASLDYNARISVEAILPNTITEVAADGVKKWVEPYDLAGPFDEPQLSADDFFLPPKDVYQVKPL
ncbi:hypothetical protein F5B22DRAFT_439226 [Xylaria bambusicola]|uniref:uncharacterized protein n=1 Tax=Xylaria bambusicola TaxID=326684 RepID=UPI002007CEBD|nr:uncharacterized protein F5B22DRAFT_439226 [Xylaria bambusicola]KAI0506663.1 hypothetical protein F5B22DRAFT_439226 [Xylaria bambusicola]